MASLPSSLFSLVFFSFVFSSLSLSSCWVSLSVCFLTLSLSLSLSPCDVACCVVCDVVCGGAHVVSVVCVCVVVAVVVVVVCECVCGVHAEKHRVSTQHVPVCTFKTSLCMPAPREHVTLERAGSTLPPGAFDVCFIKTSGSVFGVVADEGATCLALVDVDTWRQFPQQRRRLLITWLVVNMCARCRHSRGRFDRTQGYVLSGHGEGRESSSVLLTKVCPHRVITCFRGSPKETLGSNPFSSLRIGREQHVPDSSNHSLCLMKLFSFSYPEGNSGGNELLDGSISLSLQNPDFTSDWHVSIATNLHQSFS